MFNKIKGFFRSTKGKITCAVASAGATLGSTMTAFAAEETTLKDYLSQFWDMIKDQINPGTVLAVIGIVIGSVVLLSLFWFGIRYALRKIMGALKKGKATV